MYGLDKISYHGCDFDTFFDDWPKNIKTRDATTHATT